MIDPEHKQPLLTQKQILAVCVSQVVVGLFIIFMVGTFMHYYFPVSGDYGVHFEGLILGVLVALHLNRVAHVWRELVSRREEEEDVQE